MAAPHDYACVRCRTLVDQRVGAIGFQPEGRPASEIRLRPGRELRKRQFEYVHRFSAYPGDLEP